MRRLVMVLALSGCAHGDASSTVDAPPGSGDHDASTGSMIPDADCGELPCTAIYVAGFGSDTGTGDKTAPLKTIAAGIAAAKAASTAVFVGNGTYAEQITVAAGVSIYGGFDDTW